MNGKLLQAQYKKEFYLNKKSKGLKKRRKGNL